VESRRTGEVGWEEERTQAAGRKGGGIEGYGVEEDWRSRVRGGEDRAGERKGGVIEGGGVEEDWRSRGELEEQRRTRATRRTREDRGSKGWLKE
jgi:hypothetical protein